MINTKKIKNSNGFLTFYSKGSIIIPNQTDNHPYRISPHTAPRSNGRRGCRAQLPNDDIVLLPQYQNSMGTPLLHDKSSRTHSTGVANDIGNTLGIHNGEDGAVVVYQISFANHCANRPNYFYIRRKISFYTIYLSKTHIRIPPIEVHQNIFHNNRKNICLLDQEICCLSRHSLNIVDKRRVNWRHTYWRCAWTSWTFECFFSYSW